MATKTILIAEDDETLLGILVQKISLAGFNAVPAANGEIAMDILRSRPVDLLLLDIIMPKKNGMEVLAEMHDDTVLSKVPVVVVSNSGQPVEVDRAKMLGARDFLVKSVFDPSDVLEKITMYLGPAPLSGAGSSTKPNPMPTTPTAGEGRTILVVEDDKFLRELLIEKLVSSGLKVVGAVDGKEAFAAFETLQPSLIVLDIILPDINGFEILTKIRGNKMTQRIPVLILSNLDQKEDLDRANALGVSGFMIKANFSLGEIVAKINTIIGDGKKS